MPNKLILGIWNDPFMGICASLGIVQADFMGHAPLFWGRGGSAGALLSTLV